jgi:hypothetical protein
VLIVRVALLAVGLLLVVSPSQSQTTPSPKQQQAASKKGANAAEADKRGTKDSPLVIDLANTGKSDAEATNEQKNIDRAFDLQRKAFEQQGIAEERVFWLTVALVLATILQFFALLFQWRQLKRTVSATNALVDATKTEFVANQRPWVSIHYKPISDVTYDRNGTFKIEIAFTMKNHGKTPALNVILAANVFSISGDARIKQKELCSRAKERQSTQGGLGIALFPDEVSAVHRETYYISKTAITNFTREITGKSESPPEGEWVSPWLVGCVDYCFAFEEGHHQTGFIARLGHRTTPAQKWGDNKFFVKDGSVPAAKVLLEPWVLGHFAD